MGTLTPPRFEGTITVADGRRLGFAEFGRPQGRAVFWMHGTPGARRQIPEAARVAAEELGVRLVGLDRPGVGSSTAHLYGSILEFVDDLAVATDRLGIDDFAMIGLSGGGPYVLAAAYAIPDRMMAGAILGGVAPTCGPDAPEGGVVALAVVFQSLLTRLRVPLGARAVDTPLDAKAVRRTGSRPLRQAVAPRRPRDPGAARVPRDVPR